MKKKTVLFAEAAYFAGIIMIAGGTAFMEKADFGLSMIVAPAYLLYLKLSETFSFVTFGRIEYCFQALLLILMCLALRKFKLSYLFSFVTAVFYGLTLDLITLLTSGLPSDSLPFRILWYIIGILVCATGVAFVLHTYIAPEVYELICKEVPARFGFEFTKFKTIYDISSCIVAVLLSFILFGFPTLRGIGIGTVICALINGFLIGFISKKLDKYFEIRDLLPARGFFEK